MVEKTEGIGRELRNGVLVRRLVGATHAAVVEGDGAMPPGKGGHLVRPGVAVVAEAHQEQQGRTLPGRLVIQLDPVHRRLRHLGSTPSFRLLRRS
jgi:hypothetical protein